MKHFALKSIFLSLVLSLTALPSVAQSIQKITIKVPKVTRFLQIKNEGVNLRRLPNTTSGKLMIWNSDGGSIDTYAKLFYSDTEATRFRPNRNTGAYIEAYHPQKGEIMMLNPQKVKHKMVGTKCLPLLLSMQVTLDKVTQNWGGYGATFAR